MTAPAWPRRSFAAGGGSTAGINVFTPETYGAKGDARLLVDGAIATGTATLTSASAPFTAADVGKIMYVPGAGAAGAPLTTTVSAFTNATTVTLTANAGTTVTAAFAIYGTDDTTAIKSALNTAYAAGNADGSYVGGVQFTKRYLIAGALTQGGATKGNSQIPLPVVAVAGQKFTMHLLGFGDATADWHWQQTSPQISGACLVSILAGTNDGTFGEASVLGGPTPPQGYGASGSLFSNMLPVVDGLRIVVPNDPHISGYDFVGCGQANVNNAACMANATPSTVIAATAGWQFGLRMPQNNNNDGSTIGNYAAVGLNYGVFVDEHTVANNIRCIYCVAGVEVCSSGGGTGHCIQLNSISVEGSQVGIGAANAGFASDIWCGRLDWEGGGPAASFAAINDPNNTLLGTVHVKAIGQAFIVPYTSGGYQVRGANNLVVYDTARQAGATTAPSVPATTVALLNPFYRDAMVYVAGGAVTVIAVDGATLGVTSGAVLVPTNKTITLTYSVAPTWKWTIL